MIGSLVTYTNPATIPSSFMWSGTKPSLQIASSHAWRTTSFTHWWNSDKDKDTCSSEKHINNTNYSPLIGHILNELCQVWIDTAIHCTVCRNFSSSFSMELDCHAVWNIVSHTIVNQYWCVSQITPSHITG